MSAEIGLSKWKEALANDSNPEMLAKVIHKDAVFHSPVVHTPQEGQALVIAYLSAAGKTLGNGSFTYVREIIAGDQAMLEFTTEMEGIFVNGVDIITFDSDGMITDFKVMIRPLKAINKVWEMMARQLKSDA